MLLDLLVSYFLKKFELESDDKDALSFTVATVFLSLNSGKSQQKATYLSPQMTQN